MLLDWTRSLGSGTIDAYFPRREKVFNHVSGSITETESGQWLPIMQREKHGFMSPVKTKLGVTPWRDPTEYSRFLASYTSEPGSWRTDTLDVSIEETGHRFFNVGDFSNVVGNQILSANMRARLISKVMINLGNQRASWGANLGEAGVGFKELSVKTLKLASALLKFKQGNFKAFSKLIGQTAEDASSFQLGLQFGLLPMIQDVYSTYELFRRKTNDPKVINVNASLSESLSESKELPEYGSFKHEWHVKGKAGLWAIITHPQERYLNELGLTDPLAVAWELVPWSFVVDWLIPIGSVLEARRASHGLMFLGGWESSKTRGQYDFESSPNSGYQQIKAQTIRGEYLNYVRGGFNDFPSPVLFYKSPFSTSHAITASALIDQLIKKVH